MLSQEELDKLLEEGDAEGNAAGEAKDAGSDASDSEADAGAPETGSQEGPDAGTGSSGTSTGDDDAGGDDLDWSKAFEEAAEGGDSAAAKALKETESGEDQPKTQEPEFDDFAKSPSPQSSEEPANTNLDFIMDLPLEVSVELGRAKMQIRRLLQLGQGSVVELNKMAGEPAEIYVNSKLMAKGEVVVINEKFGIRLTEIISPADRVKSLG